MTSDIQTAGAQLDVPASAAADASSQPAPKGRYVAPTLVSMGSANRDTEAGVAGLGDGPTLS